METAGKAGLSRSSEFVLSRKRFISEKLPIRETVDDESVLNHTLINMSMALLLCDDHISWQYSWQPLLSDTSALCWLTDCAATSHTEPGEVTACVTCQPALFSF